MNKTGLMVFVLGLLILSVSFVSANANAPLEITWTNVLSTYYTVNVCIDNVVPLGGFTSIIIEYSQDTHNGNPPTPNQNTFTLSSGNKYCTNLSSAGPWWNSGYTLSIAKITVKNPACAGGICMQDNVWNDTTPSNWLDSNHLFIGTVKCVDADGDGYNITGGSCGPIDCNDADNAKYQLLSGYVDNDGDTYTTGSSVQVCSGASLPSGYRATANGNDCNDADANKFVNTNYYTDADNDGHASTSTPTLICSNGNAISGYSLKPGTDCNDADNTKYQLLTGYVDNDGDTYTTGSGVQVCTGATLPSGYQAVQSATPDCNDNDNTKYQFLTGYTDNDNDGYTVGSSQQICTGASLPSGYKATASATQDCNDADNTKYQLLTGYVDNDGDTYTTGSSQQICSGASLPSGYKSVQNGNDCNDADATKWVSTKYYYDVDGDGYATNVSVYICSNGGPLSGYSLTPGTDCNDNNASIYQLLTAYMDKDNDGYTLGSMVQVCSGAALPTGYKMTKSNTTDCNDNDATKYQILTGYLDKDNDGYTLSTPSQVCTGALLPAQYKAAQNGNDCNDANASIWVNTNYYTDADNDGHASTSTPTLICSNGGAVSGYSLSPGTDCNDADNTKYQLLTGYVDNDNDGYTTGNSVQVCSGASLPLGYDTTSSAESDCNDNDATIYPGAADSSKNCDMPVLNLWMPIETNPIINETESLAFYVSASDAENNPLSYAWTLDNAAQSSTTNAFTYNTDYSSGGTHIVNITVTSGIYKVSQKWTVTVNNVDRAPVLSAIGNKNVALGQTLTITLSATDADGDTLTYSKNNSIGTLVGNVFTFTPSVQQNQIVKFTVSDGTLQASETITITVTNCVDSDNDGVCDINDACIGQNQANMPASTACTTYSFNTSNGCYAVSYQPNGHVASQTDCSSSNTLCKIFSSVNNVCDGAGNLVAGTCSNWNNNDGYSHLVTCPTSGCVGTSYYTYVANGYDTCSNGNLNSYQCTYTSSANDARCQSPGLTVSDVTVFAGDTVTLNPTTSGSGTITVSYSGWMTSNNKATTSSDIGTHTVTVTANNGYLSTSKDVTVTVLDAIDLSITGAAYKINNANVYLVLKINSVSSSVLSGVPYSITGLAQYPTNYYIQKIYPGLNYVTINAPAASGTHSVDVKIDSTNAIPETNENNNDYTLEVDVP